MRRWGWALLGLVGCRAASDFSDTDANGGDPRDTANGVDDTNADSSEEPVAARYWSLDGVVAVVDGAIDASSSDLRVDLWESGASVCQAQGDTASSATGSAVLVSGSALATPPSDVPLWSWWTLSLAEGEAPCADALPVSELSLGFGAYDARLDPAADASGLGDGVNTLLGAYLLPRTDGPVWVFGVAGTEAQWSGEAPPASVVPDGIYRIQTLYLLPVE